MGLSGWLAHAPNRTWQLAVKRAVDIAGATGGLVVLSPILIATGVAVRASMGSPVFFRQARPGFLGEPFTMFKFRTMVAPGEGEVWFRTDATRITPLGAFLRRTSIDELPELFNVLWGDMSLVGPRPLLMEYLEKYTPEERHRHDMPPGITGWAQVHGRQTIRFSERLKYDLWYVRHFSLWLDAEILVRTVRDVFRSQGVIVGQNVDDVDDLGLSADRQRHPVQPPNHSMAPDAKG